MKLSVRRTYLGDRLCFPDVAGDRLVDVQAVYAWQLTRTGTHRDDAVARAAREIPCALPALLQADPGLALVRRIRDEAGASDGDIPEDCTWPGENALLGPPVGRPATIWDMTGNYPRTRHAEQGAQADAPPPDLTGFLKTPGSLAGPHDDVRYPAISEHVQPEMELAVVIGRRSSRLEAGTAMDAVAGYVGFCDLSARDIATLDNHRVDRAKGFDTFTVIGPWFVTADEIPDPHQLRVRFWVNGELRQDGSTAEMFHSIPAQLAWLTSAVSLVPGDVVATGTPPGVSPIRPGDELRGEVEGLGSIATRVVQGLPGRSQEVVRPDHRPPHVRHRGAVEPEAFGRLAEVAADDVLELVDLDLDVGVERVDVVDREQPGRHVLTRN
jgi:2-keto-4-pentenoate hydratase/2-oxohepta-3-ene-1,7-dioic acid hydratase in catechol pathway